MSYLASKRFNEIKKEHTAFEELLNYVKEELI